MAAASDIENESLYNDKGKAHFRKGEYHQAIEQFSKALDCAVNALKSNKEGKSLTQDSAAAKYLVNRAAANAQERYAENAVVDVTAALQLPMTEDLRIKALFRRADALSELEQNLDVALDDIKEVLRTLEFKKNSSSQYETLYNRALTREREVSSILRSDDTYAQATPSAGDTACQSEEDLFAGNDEKTLDIIHKYHSWRLVPINSMQRVVAADHWHTATIGVRNEFGLFQKGFIRPENLVLKGFVLSSDSGLNTEPSLQLELQCISPIWKNLKCITRCSYFDDINDMLLRIDPQGMKAVEGQDPCFDEHGKCIFRYRLTTKDKIESGNPLCRILFCAELEEGGTIGDTIHSILPVCTPPLEVTQQSKDENGGSYPGLCMRHFGWSIAQSGKEKKPTSYAYVEFEEDPGNLGIGGKLWDSGMLLAKFLCKLPEVCQNCHFVELGSGTGVSGLALASVCNVIHASCEGLLTDIEEVVPFLKRQIDVNEHAERISPPAGVQLHATTLDWSSTDLSTVHWTNGASLKESPPSLVLGADIIYDIETYDALLATFKSITDYKVKEADKAGSCHRKIKSMLQYMLKGKDVGDEVLQSLSHCSSSFCLIAYRTRHEDAKKFWEKFCELFHVVHAQRDDGELSRVSAAGDVSDPERVHRIMPDSRIISTKAPRSLKFNTSQLSTEPSAAQSILTYSRELVIPDVGFFFCWRKRA